MPAVSVQFQSTHPVGGATRCNGRGAEDADNFNPRTPWGVRQQHDPGESTEAEISIHAPRGGCDDAMIEIAGLVSISIHAPRGGCDPMASKRNRIQELFQSTHPVGGATRWPAREIGYKSYFNPRTPWGVRPDGQQEKSDTRVISIHAPRGGCDRRRRWGDLVPGISIHAPRGGCDQNSLPVSKNSTISIHAPRGGCDSGIGCKRKAACNFNPRTPWGVRPLPPRWRQKKRRFQSTHPVGGATFVAGLPVLNIRISIHAPRGGCDVFFFLLR